MKQIITTLLLATVVILSSCSKEDDLLTPVPNPTTINQPTDTITYTVTGNDTTVLCPWDEGYSPDESLTTTTNNVLNLEGNKYNVTYSSFYLRNRFPICAIPTDTTIFEENINTGIEEVYFSNQGDGYLNTKVYARDCETPLYNVAIINPPWYYTQPIESYTVENNKIIVNTVYQYSITFDIVENTNTRLVIESTHIWLEEPNPNIGYLGVDCVRTVRLELEKVN